MKGAANIPSIYAISNPIGAFFKMLHTHSSLTNATQIKATNKSIETLLEISQQRVKDERFLSSVQIYKDYMDMFLKNIPNLKENNFMFLDFTNYCLETEYGTFSKKCIDDFAIESEFAKLIMDIHNKSSDKIQDYLENTVFYRMSMFDFPFILKQNSKTNEVFIEHPFKDQVNKIQKQYESDNKWNLGFSSRSANDELNYYNYKFSSIILSEKNFTKQLKNVGFIENLHNGFSKLGYDVSLDEFIGLNKNAIKLNRQLLKNKYATIIDILNIQEPLAYMCERDEGLKILRQASNKVRIPGEKLLQNTKDLPLRGVFEPQAIRRLLGMLQAKYDPENEINLEFTNHIPEEPLQKVKQYPFIKTLGNPKSTLEGLKRIYGDGFKLLQKDVIDFSYSVTGIEGIILALNRINFSIHTDKGISLWQNQIKNNLVNPYDISDIQQRSVGKLVRPSNCGKKCEFDKYVSMIPLDFWPQDCYSEASLIGTAIHSISNEIDDLQYLELEKFGIKPIKRDKYCEVPIEHHFRPTDYDFNNTIEAVKVKLSKTKSIFYEILLENIVNSDQTLIIDGGKSDAMLIVEDTNELVVVDFKRRMSGYYPVQYFFEQASRYALAVIQSKQLDVNKFHTLIIQSPYSFNKFAQMQGVDDGTYNDQIFNAKTINLNSYFVNNVKKNLMLEFFQNKLFKNNINLGFHLRELYKDIPEQNYPSCKSCFSNSKDSYQCRFLLEGKFESW